jgi:hypothetical protein
MQSVMKTIMLQNISNFRIGFLLNNGSIIPANKLEEAKQLSATETLETLME